MHATTCSARRDHSAAGHSLPAWSGPVGYSPAGTNLDRWLDVADVTTNPPVDPRDEQAAALLGEPSVDADVRLIGAVLAHRDGNRSVGLVADDRRVRTVARGLDATVTGTIGVLVRAVDDVVSPAEARRILRRIDEHGLHMTAELRAHANSLIDDAAD